MSLDNLSDATLVLVGHGSTLNAESGAPVYQHATELRRRHLFAEVREAFLIREPKLSKVMSGLGNRRVFVAPLFISQGYITSQIIPRELDLSGARRTGRDGPAQLTYCRPVGDHPSMTRALLARARDVVERFPFPRKPPPGLTTLFIAGHGTERDDGSRLAVQRQVETIHKAGLYAAVHAVFLEEPPHIADCYGLARTPNLVVAPFFISDGQHTMHDIPTMLGEPDVVVTRRLAAGQLPWPNPTEKNHKLVWYASAVGNEPGIADVIVESVRESALAEAAGQ